MAEASSERVSDGAAFIRNKIFHLYDIFAFWFPARLPTRRGVCSRRPALSDLLDRNNFLIYVSSLYAFCLTYPGPCGCGHWTGARGSAVTAFFLYTLYCASCPNVSWIELDVCLARALQKWPLAQAITFFVTAVVRPLIYFFAAPSRSPLSKWNNVTRKICAQWAVPISAPPITTTTTTEAVS